MKRNAITRIIVYSVIVCILLGILLAGLGIGLFMVNFDMSETSYTTSSNSSGSVSASDVRNITVEWVAGSIDVQVADVDSIQFSESGSFVENQQFVWQVNGDTLQILYCKPQLQFGFISTPSKDLTITLPQNWLCHNLDIETVSADVTIANLTADKLEIEGTSALCNISQCSIQDVSISTVSGNVDYMGIVDTLSCESVSAKCTITLSSPARSIDMECVSGNLIVSIPEECGFTASLDTASGNITTDFPAVMENGTYVYADGRCKITAESVSGHVTVQKAD